MKPTILSTVIGIIAFIIIMYFGYKYANGKMSVNKHKTNDYLIWVDVHGKKVKKGIFILSIIYAIAMSIQILSFIYVSKTIFK